MVLRQTNTIKISFRHPKSSKSQNQIQKDIKKIKIFHQPLQETRKTASIQTSQKFPKIHTQYRLLEGRAVSGAICSTNQHNQVFHFNGALNFFSAPR